MKLDKPRVISGIDIGNERSGFIEVLVGNSQQDPPPFKEILLATSFMTITEARSDRRPNHVRCFPRSAPLIESVAKEKWDLVKIVCTQPFNNRIQYGVSFITLHTPEDIKNDDSPVKKAQVTQQVKTDDSAEKKIKFGKFTMRASSESDSEDDKKKKESPFNRWKSSKSDAKDSTVSIKDQVRAKLEENRKRIRMIPDSSEEDQPKPKPKLNRNRTTGLVYEDEDDEPNEKLQKKIDKDNEQRDKEKKTPRRDQTPTNSDSKKIKFDAFINHDAPSTSSSPSRNKSPSRSSKPSSSSKRPPTKSPRKDKEPERKSIPAPLKGVSYKPFHKLLEGVVLAFSGYVNPERGALRQKALDMGAKYKGDWDSRCTHLM